MQKQITDYVEKLYLHFFVDTGKDSVHSILRYH